MERILSVVVLGGIVIAQTLLASAQSSQTADPNSVFKSESASGGLPSLRAIPRGKSTILGGEIRNVDPVLDRFNLQVMGQRPMRILFDQRTQVFLDGKRISLTALHSNEHASVQTVLDGTDVFAISIHMLSQTPEGEFQGHVLNYNPGTGELMVNSAMTREPFKLLVRSDTSVVREGQGAFSSVRSGPADLINGALISAEFESNKDGRAVASQISILAIPGSDFVFSGNLSSLDMHSGLLVLIDPRDEKSYNISFDPARFPASENLHQGDHVRVSAAYDGSRYVATAITAN